MPLILTRAQKQIFSWLGIAGLLALLVWGLAPVMLPFVLAAILAYVLHPLVERLAGQRQGRTWKVPRVLAVLLVSVFACLAAAALLLLLVPVLLQGLEELRKQLPGLGELIQEHLVPWLRRLGLGLPFGPEGWRAFAKEHLGANSEQLLLATLASARIGGSALVALAGYLVLVPVVLFYLLMDWPRLMAMGMELVPPRVREAVAAFATEADAVLGQYLRGQLLVMGVLAVYYSGSLLLLGFQLAIPVGVFTGLAVFVPFVGFALGLILALVAALLQFGSWYGVAAVAVVYGVGQVVESVYLTPRLLGERIGLHPVAVIFALLAFGHLLGFIGVLLALPLSAVAVVAIRRIRAAYLGSSLYAG